MRIILRRVTTLHRDYFVLHCENRATNNAQLSLRDSFRLAAQGTKTSMAPAAAAGVGEATHGSGHDRRGRRYRYKLSGRFTDEFSGNGAGAAAPLLGGAWIFASANHFLRKF